WRTPAARIQARWPTGGPNSPARNPAGRGPGPRGNGRAPPPGAPPPGPRAGPMGADPRCSLGGADLAGLGAPARLVCMAGGAAEEHGWDGFFVWDHQLWWDPEWDVADAVVVVAAVAARTARIRTGILVNVLARRRAGKVARESVTLDQLSHGRLVVGAGLG